MLIVGVIILCTLYIRNNGAYCNIWESFLNNKGEEDDACIARLIERADAGDDHAVNRLMYPSQAYIKRVCEKGVENLSERERYYFQGFSGDRCEIWGFKTPKSKGDEANTTSGGGNLARGDTNTTDGGVNLTCAEANNGESSTTSNKADKTKREENSTEEQNAGR
ncbi:hypothetical protein [uncultured Campylobacter sp.]|uniref:hypothetical protein n=1 Tax=uncultured Campylobacter sp. TaxID=218934 RepID=UPI002608BD37|nr:hypothetical protein [uncultured Campylobacter sp.]